MDDCILRFLTGNATDADVKALAEWRAASPGNERRFSEIRRVWELTGPIRSRPTRPAPSAAAIIARAEAGPRIHPTIRWAALAAALVLAAAWGWLRLRTGEPGGEVYAAKQLPLTVTLADGSFVQLRPGGRLEYRATASTREVRLEGTGFFAVAQRGAEPFTIETGEARVTVLGTRFEVRHRADSVRVAVVDGAVSVATHAGTVRLEPGELGLTIAGSAPTRRAVTDVLAELDGPPPLLFQRTELAHVSQELARHFGRPIIVTDSALASRPVTARFEGETFTDALTAVCLVVRARCRLDTTPARIER